ncbi:MAG: cation diffusion facilitator family transporter [Alphaproteobacteria bacterium]|nr:cation diffusion facilitator family transporter [Alphaproteobacteria bacterium]
MAQQLTTDTQDGRLMRLATYASVGTACVLILVKLTAWLMTGSVAVLSSLTDSLLDIVASIINLLAVRHALTPADHEHRFGHGKAEPLSGLFQAAFVAGSGALLVIEAISRLYESEAVQNESIGIGVMLFSIAATVALVRFQTYVARRTRSVAIGADSLHYTGDVLINGGVLISLLLSAWLGWRFIDPLFGAGIAVYLMINAYRIGRGALDLLMDRELDDRDRQRIRDIVLAHQEVHAIHDLRTRSAGRQTFIQCHVEMDGSMTLMRAHEIGDAVETELTRNFPGAEVIIHQDPAGLDEPTRRFH